MTRKFPVSARYLPLAWLLAIFLVVSALTRLVLLVAASSGVPPGAGHWVTVFGIGLAYDLMAFVYFAWPMVLLLWLLRCGVIISRFQVDSVVFTNYLLAHQM